MRRKQSLWSSATVSSDVEHRDGRDSPRMRDSPRPRAHQRSATRRDGRLVARGSDDTNGGRDTSLACTGEERTAEVALVARVVASLVLKWEEYTTSLRARLASSSSSKHAGSREVAVASTPAGLPVPSTRWIAHLNAWENAEKERVRHAQCHPSPGGRVASASRSVRADDEGTNSGLDRARPSDQPLSAPLPAEVLEGIVDSAGVMLRGVESTERECHRLAREADELAAELRALRKDNKHLRARLEAKGEKEKDEVHAGESRSAPAPITHSPLPSTARVDPVLARMIVEATQATLREHYTHSHRGAPGRSAKALEVSSKPPLAGAIVTAVPTATIPAPPYAPSSPPRRTSPSPGRRGEEILKDVTPPTAARADDRSEEVSPTILSPLTEVYSLSDPRRSHRKPSRSRSPNTAVVRSGEEEAARTAEAAAAQAQQEAQMQQLREAYEAEVNTVAQAQRRLTALASTIDVLRAQLALADDQRDLEVEEARLCTVAQQALFDEEQSARWALAMHGITEWQSLVQKSVRALTEAVARPPSMPNATSARAGVPVVGKRIHFVPAAQARTVTGTRGAATAHPVHEAPRAASSAVLFTRDRHPHTAPDSSISSVSESDVPVHVVDETAPPSAPGGLPARRLPARPHGNTPASTTALTDSTAPVAGKDGAPSPPSSSQASPIVRRQAPHPFERVAASRTSDHSDSLTASAPAELEDTRHPLPDKVGGKAAVLSPPSPSHGARLITSPAREVHAPEENAVRWASPSSASAVSRQAQPSPPSSYVARLLTQLAGRDTEDEEKEDLGGLRWQRAKQAAVVESIRRDSHSRRHSTGGGESGAKTQLPVLSPEPHTAYQGPVSPASSPPDTRPGIASAQGTARPLLTALDAEAGSPQGVPSLHSPPSNGAKEITPHEVMRTTAVKAPSAAILSVSPPRERTPKSISHFYAEPLEDPEVAYADDRLGRSESRDAEVGASPPPRPPPAAAITFASSSTLQSPPRVAGPLFELP